MSMRTAKIVGRGLLPRWAMIGLLFGSIGAVSLGGMAMADQPLSNIKFPGNLGHLPQLPNQDECKGGDIKPQGLRLGSSGEGQQKDLLISGPCTISTSGKYAYGQINIIGPKGSLKITEPTSGSKDIDIWASSIIIEYEGKLIAGEYGKAYGAGGGTLTFYIYGRNQSVDATGTPIDPATTKGQGIGALCNGELVTGKSGPCGIPWSVWDANGSDPSQKLPGGVTDRFYQYGPLYGDARCAEKDKNKITIWTPGKLCGQDSDKKDIQVGYFGYKVLALSYGGTLQLFGYEGTPLPVPASTKNRNNNAGGGSGLFGSLGMTGAPAQGASAADAKQQTLIDYYRQLFKGQNGGGGSGGGNGGGSPPPTATSLPECGKSTPDSNPAASACSWLRLAGDLTGPTDANKNTGETSLTLSAEVGDRWKANDTIVVTSTDYLPGHYEQLTISKVDGKTITFKEPIKWPHRGTTYTLSDKIPSRLTAAGMDPKLVADGAETRAAVALLTRSIRIVSAGDDAAHTWEQESSDPKNCKANPPAAAPAKGFCYSFGAHMVVRQGFEKLQIQGVEFADMGQPGKLGHYPIHFHMARQVPADVTYIKDSVINESMTRWIVLHATQGVLLQRNVGYKSIGHGFYLEDGTETDNKFYSNLGILVRAAVDNAQNRRKLPGILADSQSPFDKSKFAPPNVPNPGFPFRSDAEYPSGFWITNGWNEFVGNMISGVGACGSGYWFVPMLNTDMPDVPTDKNTDTLLGWMHMLWTDDKGSFGYAGLQRNSSTAAFEGTSPLKVFYKNSVSSAMMSFQTTPDAPNCDGFLPPDATTSPPDLKLPVVYEIRSFSPAPLRHTVVNHTEADVTKDPYYPHTHGARFATLCDASSGKPDCSKVTAPCARSDESNCGVTVLDHFTSSFTWAHGNVAAVWLRPQWYLLTNSVLSDVQSGAVTFITGGDFTHSSVIPGYWAVMLNSVLIGHSQSQSDDAQKKLHRFALDLGPVNKFTRADATPLKCADLTSTAKPNYCLLSDESISLPVINFFLHQRMFNIYDGPAYQDSNAYLDINTEECDVGDYNATDCIYGANNAVGVLKDPADTTGKPCYLPNAAIGWKQPNGFFYPPAFHSLNLFFSNVDIRHYVTDPLFKAFKDSDSTNDFGQGGSYITDPTAVGAAYCTQNGQMFNDYTSIDRQTELNDADGTLTGLSNDVTGGPASLKQTISVNEDAFFTAPVEAPECGSNIGANVLPANACSRPTTAAPMVTAKTSPYDYVATVVFHQPNADWDGECTNPQCYGVPLYRQDLAGDKATKTREWAHWNDNGCNTDPTTVKCRWPFIRMAGTSIGTRETLTVNNGIYYIDTTVPLDVQKDIYKEPGHVLVSRGEQYNTQAGAFSIDSLGNVFKAGDTYYVFFLYAKQSTRQTYQIYVGDDPAFGSVKPIQVKIPTKALVPEPYTGSKSYLIPPTKVENGVITVTVDFTGVTALDPTPGNGLCQPSKYCKASGDSCVRALDDNDPAVKMSPTLAQDVARACSKWASKDLDCPKDGCLGFSFTLPDATKWTADATLTNPSPHRPTPGSFAENTNKGKPDWLVKFFDPGADAAGNCKYSTLPSYVKEAKDGECPTPDWVPEKAQFK